MLDLTVLCGIDRAHTGVLASALALREKRIVTAWIDPSTAFLGRIHAELADCVGWQETLHVDLDCSCIGCGYLQAVRATIARVVETGRYDLMVLQLAPSVEPDSALESLCATLDADAVRLDTVVTVLQAGAWLDDLAGGQELGERGIGVQIEDDRLVCELIASQIAAADCLVVAGELRDEEAAALNALAPSVTPVATADLLELPSQLFVRTGRHRPRCLNAFDGDGLLDWSHQPQVAGGLEVVRWSADRPFHPERLYDALEPLADQVIRSSGRIVIASTADRWTRWESSGESMSLGDLGPRGDEPVLTRLSLLGVGLDADRIASLLEMSLLTDGELAAGPALWRRLDDPFAVDIHDDEGDQ